MYKCIEESPSFIIPSINLSEIEITRLGRILDIGYWILDMGRENDEERKKEGCQIQGRLIKLYPIPF